MSTTRKQYQSNLRCSSFKPAARSIAVLGAALVTLSGSMLTSHAQNLTGKADQSLTRQHTTLGWIQVIARCPRPLTPAQERQLKSVNADITRHLPLIDAFELRVPSRRLSQLAALPFVTHLSYDGPVHKCDAFTTGSSGATAAYSQYGLTGQGVGVAILDTGVHFCNDLAKTIKGGSSRITANQVFSTTCTDDFVGHGTHVAGIIAGNGAASTGNSYTQTFYGVARQANIVNVKVLDDTGAGTVGGVIQGLQWAVTNKTKYNIRVLNLSLGHPVGESYTTDPLCQAVEAAWKAGIVVVCAAGNEGRLNSTSNTPGMDNEGWGTAYGSISAPGNDPYVITVGAMKQTNTFRADDRIATYSGRGPSRLDLVLKPDIVAPGNQVISTNTNNSYLSKNFGSTNLIPYALYSTANAGHLSQDYFRLSGTSMATPVVAGAAALLLQQDSTLTPDTIKARLMLSADKWVQPDGTADPCTYGAGYLNIPAALQSKALPNQAAMSPSLSIDASGNVYINMDRAIWGVDSLTSTRAIWGVSGVADTRAVWGTRAIWGVSTNVLSASRAIWGTSVWNDRAIWGVNSSAVDLTNTAISGE